MCGSLRVTTIGTGTCVPRLDRRGPCVLLQAGGTSVAVDLGLGALHGLLRAGLRHDAVDAVLLTHLHPDHTAEIVPFLFAANYDEVPRTRGLFLGGGAGLAPFLDGLRVSYGRWLEPRGYELLVRQLSAAEEFRIGPVRCRSGAVSHTESSLAYRFESEGRSVVVSGDTGPSPELERLAAGCDLLVLEASLAGEKSVPGHLTAAEAGELAGRAGVRRLVLTHLYPSADASAPGEEASRAFGGPVSVARDGQTFAPGPD